MATPSSVTTKQCVTLSTQNGENGDPVKISSEDWHEFKGVIRQKYIFENLTLHQIQTYMSDTHDFKASLNQYQRILKKWNLRKNSKRKDYEQAIVLAKRRKLDLGDIQITGVHANVQKRLKRSLHRYDIPGLEYVSNVNTEQSTVILRSIPDTTHTLQTQVNPIAKFQNGRLQLLSSSTLDLRYIKDLPVLNLVDELSNRSRQGHQYGSGNGDERITKTLFHLLHPIQTTNEDVEVILGARTFDLWQTVLTSIVYDIANDRYDGFELRPILRWIVEHHAERLLEPIFKADLHAAKACSENILKALFQLELTWTPTDTFRRLFDLILESQINVNLTIWREVWDYGIPIEVTLLQLSLLLGNLSLASRLLDAGADINYCAEHGNFTNHGQQSCCELLPIILLTERVDFTSGQEAHVQDMWKRLLDSGLVYCKDISMVRLTHQSLIMQSLFAQDIGPDIISKTLPRVVFKKRDRPLSCHGDKEIFWLTALQNAVDQHDLLAAEMLLDAGADPAGCSVESLEEFFSALSAPIFVDWKGQSVSRPAELAHLLLPHFCAMTPLSIASYHGHVQMVQLLLNRQAALNRCQFDRYHKSSVCELDKSSYTKHSQYSTSQTPLKSSIRNLLEILSPSQDVKISTGRKLFRGALASDPLVAHSNHDPILGCGPLQMAVSSSRVETVLFLLEAGADIEGCHGLTPLGLAIRNSDNVLVDILLEHGADPHGLTSHGPTITPLAVAAFLNNVLMLRLLFDKMQQPVCVPARAGKYSIWQAALEGNALDAWRFLSEAAENGVLVCTPDDKTELVAAAIGVVSDTFIRELVSYWRGDISQVQLQTLLSKSARQNRPALVRFFLEQGASANDVHTLREAITILPPPGEEDEYWADEYLADERWEDKSPLVEVLVEDRFGLKSDTISLAFGLEELTKYLRTRENPRFTVRVLMTRWTKTQPYLEGHEVYKMMEMLLVHRRKIHEDICDTMLLLLEHGSYKNDRTCHCLPTPLQFASEWGKLRLAQELVNLGADVNANAAEHGCRHGEMFGSSRGGGPMTALNYAVVTSDLQMTKLLLTAGASVHIPHQRRFHSRISQTTTLQLAASTPECSLELLQCLLDHGADMNSSTDDDVGMTVLQSASVYGEKELIEFLLDQGADINGPIAPWHGMSALQQAAYWGRSELVTLLLDRGADVNAEPAKHGGLTALQAASLKGHFSICLQLIAAGADPDAARSENQGGTAIECAASSGRLDILKLLLDLWVERYGTSDEEVLRGVLEGARYQALKENHNYIVAFVSDYERDILKYE